MWPPGTQVAVAEWHVLVKSCVFQRSVELNELIYLCKDIPFR